MRSSADFRAVTRSGGRARRGPLVISLSPGLRAPDCPPLVGLVVGKTVGNAVVRHTVSRRLRAQLAARLPLLPPGSGTVVRALPEAASATSAELGSSLDAALGRLLPRGAEAGLR
jgi:ribonuclease P protein component